MKFISLATHNTSLWQWTSPELVMFQHAWHCDLATVCFRQPYLPTRTQSGLVIPWRTHTSQLSRGACKVLWWSYWDMQEMKGEKRYRVIESVQVEWPQPLSDLQAAIGSSAVQYSSLKRYKNRYHPAPQNNRRGTRAQGYSGGKRKLQKDGRGGKPK